MIEGNPYDEGLMDDVEARDQPGDAADFEQKQCVNCGGPVDELSPV